MNPYIDKSIAYRNFIFLILSLLYFEQAAANNPLLLSTSVGKITITKDCIDDCYGWSLNKDGKKLIEIDALTAEFTPVPKTSNQPFIGEVNNGVYFILEENPGGSGVPIYNKVYYLNKEGSVKNGEELDGLIRKATIVSDILELELTGYKTPFKYRNGEVISKPEYDVTTLFTNEEMADLAFHCNGGFKCKDGLVLRNVYLGDDEFRQSVDEAIKDSGIDITREILGNNSKQDQVIPLRFRDENFILASESFDYNLIFLYSLDRKMLFGFGNKTYDASEHTSFYFGSPDATIKFLLQLLATPDNPINKKFGNERKPILLEGDLVTFLSKQDRDFSERRKTIKSTQFSSNLDITSISAYDIKGISLSMKKEDFLKIGNKWLCENAKGSIISNHESCFQFISTPYCKYSDPYRLIRFNPYSCSQYDGQGMDINKLPEGVSKLATIGGANVELISVSFLDSLTAEVDFYISDTGSAYDELYDGLVKRYGEESSEAEMLPIGEKTRYFVPFNIITRQHLWKSTNSAMSISKTVPYGNPPHSRIVIHIENTYAIESAIKKAKKEKESEIELQKKKNKLEEQIEIKKLKNDL